MYKPDDNDIDRLSKNAAEHYHAPGEPSWDALQQMLDKELPLEKKKKRRGFFFFFLLMGLSAAGSLTWYAAKQYNQNKTVVASVPTPLTATEPGEPASPEAAAVKQSDAATKEGITANNTATTQTTADKKTESTKATIAFPTKEVKNSQAEGNTTTSNKKSNKTAVDNPAVLVAKVKKPPLAKPTAAKFNNDNAQSLLPVTENTFGNQPVTVNKNGSKQNKQTTRDNSPQAIYSSTNTTAGTHKKNKPSLTPAKMKDTGNDDAVSYNSSNKKRNKKAGNQLYVASVPDQNNTPGQKNSGHSEDSDADNNSSNPVEEKVSAAAVATLPDTATAAKPTATAQPVAKTVIKDSAAAAKTKKKAKPGRAINIGLIAGADYSTIKFTNSDKAGYNLGLMGGYQFNKHWSVYTGLVYTKKNYTLNGKDYHPPQHYFTYYVDLQTVNGDCHMWEVPLLARYTFNPAARTAFFASAGLSSYFMKKQSYDYMYKNSWNQPMTGSWATDSTFTHAFSILHISGGIEKRIGKNMNFQIEPYAKIPLGGVGFGNIRLSSFGVNLSVQYRYPVKR